MEPQRVWPFFLPILLCLAAGCHREQAELPLPIPDHLAVGERYPLEPIITHVGLTGRSVLACTAGYCVILHYPPAPVEIEDLTSVLEDDPHSDQDNGEVYDDPRSPWCSPNVVPSALNTFNCCTFAVGDVVGLTPRDWIRPIPSGDTYFTAPMEVLLDSFFRRVKIYPAPKSDWSRIENDSDLQEDDVICFVAVGREYTTYTHVGKIFKRLDKNWIISKFGAGPILRTTLRATAAKFSDQFDQVWVYRATL
jgi:hypothetical protein